MQKVRDVMTATPLVLDAQAPLQDAARHMRDHAVGDVLVTDGERLCGIVTDRDLVVRALADGYDPRATTVGQVCSRDLVAVEAEDDVQHAVDTMRGRAIRRVPVIDQGRLAGVVSLGDLARHNDENSLLAAISEAPPNA
jgi:signal-transduction protein with cAMP-binding, CBS, and nucleotidyltransferase domain